MGDLIGPERVWILLTPMVEAAEGGVVLRKIEPFEDVMKQVYPKQEGDLTEYGREAAFLYRVNGTEQFSIEFDGRIILRGEEIGKI